MSLYPVNLFLLYTDHIPLYANLPHADGAGVKPARSFVYDLENRPLAITRGGVSTGFTYGADGARVSKSFGAAKTVYLGAEAELLFDAANPTGQLSSTLHPDVKRVGMQTLYLVKDHLDLPRNGSASLNSLTNIKENDDGTNT
jgi:hypothetical protein